jgi:hypothetical protein
MPCSGRVEAFGKQFEHWRGYQPESGSILIQEVQVIRYCRIAEALDGLLRASLSWKLAASSAKLAWQGEGGAVLRAEQLRDLAAYSSVVLYKAICSLSAWRESGEEASLKGSLAKRMHFRLTRQ